MFGRFDLPMLCVAFAAAGPAIILLNKRILSTLQFPFPYALTAHGLVCSALISFVAVKGGWIKLSHDRSTPPRNLKWWMLTILPIGICQALAMGFGTVAYLSLTVAFIQMLKAFTPVITLIVLYAFGVEKPGKMLVMSIIGISIGTFLAVVGEVQFDLFGFTIHEISAVAEAMRVVLTQKLLLDAKFHPIEGLYYMAPAGALCMILLVTVFELKTMLDTGAFWIIHNNPTHFLGASALGFVLNILSFMILKASSAVLLKGISVSRTAALVLFCAAFLGEEVSFLEGLGYVVSLACFVWYNAIRIGIIKEDSGGHSPKKPLSGRASPIAEA